jgi:hypothetical protein
VTADVPLPSAYCSTAAVIIGVFWEVQIEYFKAGHKAFNSEEEAPFPDT